MNHSAAAAYTSMAQPFGVSAHTPPHMPPTVRQDSMSKLAIIQFSWPSSIKHEISVMTRFHQGLDVLSSPFDKLLTLPNTGGLAETNQKDD